ncbi:MAG TPA: FHA domain-containing protein [Pirellulales bacterium]
MKPLVQSHCQASIEPTRFWLWVDGVGGFLVCEGAEYTIGQPVGAGVDIGILADISSRHAVIHRRQDDYMLEPLRPVAIDGRTLKGPALLADRATIQLGASVRLAFRRPHPYSNSACLAIASQHRTSPSCDGVLLAGDSLVLGPGPRAHIQCPAGSGEILLYRQQSQWFCRAAAPLEIDGQAATGGGPLGRSSRVVSPDFSFTLEEAG